MKGNRIQRMVVAITALGLGALVVFLGTVLVPARAIAEERGITVQWALTWIMIWMTTLAAATLAGFLVGVGSGKRSF
jgi:hypothetical protein